MEGGRSFKAARAGGRWGEKRVDRHGGVRASEILGNACVYIDVASVRLHGVFVKRASVKL